MDPFGPNKELGGVSKMKTCTQNITQKQENFSVRMQKMKGERIVYLSLKFGHIFNFQQWCCNGSYHPPFGVNLVHEGNEKIC